jgi:hypothetical protein
VLELQGHASVLGGPVHVTELHLCTLGKPPPPLPVGVVGFG